MQGGNETRQLVIFHAGSMICAIEASSVAEILKQQSITHIHRAPDYVRGVINLRGSIVTVLDLKKKLSISETEAKNKNVIIVPFKGENVGLFVDDVIDISNVPVPKIQNPPSNLTSSYGSYLKGVYSLEDELVSILDVEAILMMNEAPASTSA